MPNQKICCQNTIHTSHAAIAMRCTTLTAAKRNSITHAAAARSNLDAAIPLRSANTDTTHVSVFLQAKRKYSHRLMHTRTASCLLTSSEAGFDWRESLSFAIYVTKFAVQTWQCQFSPDDPRCFCARYRDIQGPGIKLGHFLGMTSAFFVYILQSVVGMSRDVERLATVLLHQYVRAAKNRWIGVTVQTCSMCLSHFECVWFNALED